MAAGRSSVRGRSSSHTRLRVAHACALAIGCALSLHGVIAQAPLDTVWARRPTSAGAYKAVRELSGRMELTQYSARGNPRDLDSVCAARQEAETTALETTEGQVRALESDTNPDAVHDQIWVRHAAAQMRAYRGEMAMAVAHLRAALARAKAAQATQPGFGAIGTELQALIGIAEIRRGELENCVHDRNAARCIFPLTRPGEHQHTSGAEAALAAFLPALAEQPADLELRWLANLAAMLLGRHPDALPSAQRLPRERFEGPVAIPRMVDAAPELGLSLVDRAGGAVFDDFNADGRLDLVLSTVDPCRPLHFFVQQPDGTFIDTAQGAGLAGQLGGINLAHADYDNDGDPDLFVMRGGWEAPIRNSLLRNEGDGSFTDVTTPAGLLDVPHSTHSAMWADFDLDGWLDLFVGHEDTPSKLFRNAGDGTFTDVTRRAGIAVNAFTKGVAWGDYDRDGDPDLYVSNYGSPNVLYRNNADGTFTDVATLLGVDRPIMSFATWFFDYDNDGWEDLFVAGFVPSVVESLKHYTGEPTSADTSRLYRNRQGLAFEDVSAAAGLDRAVLAMGANFGDIDNDGWLDFYLGTGAPSYAALVPNLLFLNREGRSFADVTASSGTGHLQKGHGVAFGDVDRDGDEDLFVNVGGFVPGDSYNKVLFRNPGNTHGWLRLELRGTRTNRSGLGARVAVVVRRHGGAERTISRVVTTGGSFGGNPRTLRVGLGDAERVERVEIAWPVSRTTQVVTDVPSRQTILVQEGRDGWTAPP